MGCQIIKERDGMLDRKMFQKGARYGILGLPLAAIIGSSFLPLKPITNQLLILASLIWLQIIILFEVFLAN